MYENAIDGVIPDSISDLEYLIWFNIFNDAREYEYIVNSRRNTIYKWNQNIHNLGFLEEINFLNLEMQGTLDSTFNNLSKLRVINLSRNNMTGSLPNTFNQMPNLEVVQLSDNQFDGDIPSTLAALEYLKIVELNDNGFTGTIPTFVSQHLTGLEFSSNSLSGSFPTEYFVSNSYPKLDFVNANFNNFAVPSH